MLAVLELKPDVRTGLKRRKELPHRRGRNLPVLKRAGTVVLVSVVYVVKEAEQTVKAIPCKADALHRHQIHPHPVYRDIAQTVAPVAVCDAVNGGVIVAGAGHPVLGEEGTGHVFRKRNGNVAYKRIAVTVHVIGSLRRGNRREDGNNGKKAKKQAHGKL